MVLLTNIALKFINGERVERYGKPEDSFKDISIYWTTILRAKGLLPVDVQLDRQTVMLMMVDLKVARESRGHKRDNIGDLIGYAALFDETEDKK